MATKKKTPKSIKPQLNLPKINLNLVTNIILVILLPLFGAILQTLIGWGMAKNSPGLRKLAGGVVACGATLAVEGERAARPGHKYDAARAEASRATAWRRGRGGGGGNRRD